MSPETMPPEVGFLEYEGFDFLVSADRVRELVRARDAWIAAGRPGLLPAGKEGKG